MSTLPQVAEAFYALRDDRTNRCCVTARYQTAGCAVYVSESSVSTVAGQAMLIAAANLLSRWCRRVTIVLQSQRRTTLVGDIHADLGGYILEQMRDADPFGEFEIQEGGVVAADVNLIIGSEVPSLLDRGHVVFIDASGWLASLSLARPIALPPALDGNVLGAIAAACLGVAQIFKIAMGMPAGNMLRDGVLDLFRHAWSTDLISAPWPTNLQVGRILMVGAGSVGSAAAYCMRLSGSSGTVTVVDGDLVKIENFNRSPVFGCGVAGLPKAEAIARFLSGSTFFATPIPTWWDAFLAQRGRSTFDFDVWLPLANEFNVRSAMQHHVPPLMIHASTTSNWGVNHGRHLPGRDDCLADRFPLEASPAALSCSTGRIDTPEVAVDAALPFASMFAGLLVTADLVRAQLPGYPQVPNFALFDWYGSLDTIQAWDRRSRQGCICRDQGRQLQDIFNAETRYRPLFAV